MLAGPLGACIEQGGDEAVEALARIERAGLEPASSASGRLRFMDLAGEDVPEGAFCPLLLPLSEEVLEGRALVVALAGPPPRRSERGEGQALEGRGWGGGAPPL